MTATRRKRAVAIGKSLAEHLFKDMSDPLNRGPAFKWAKFPAMAASRARTHLFLHVSYEVTAAEKDAASQAARALARKLVAENKLLDA